MKDFGSTLIQKQGEMVQSIVTKLRGSQRDPSGLPFKLAGKQHVYLISTGVEASKKIQERMLKGISKLVKNTCKAIHKSTQMRIIVSKERQKKNCILEESSCLQSIQHKRKELCEKGPRSNQYHTMFEIRANKIIIWSKSKGARRVHPTTFDNISGIS